MIHLAPGFILVVLENPDRGKPFQRFERITPTAKTDESVRIPDGYGDTTINRGAFSQLKCTTKWHVFPPRRSVSTTSTLKGRPSAVSKIV